MIILELQDFGVHLSLILHYILQKDGEDHLVR